MRNKWILLICTVLISLSVQAQELSFPDEELPSESVIPVLDSPMAVLNRTLTYTWRMEATVFTGWLLDEPFYANQYFGVAGLYHFSEMTSWGLMYRKWSTGLSSYSNQFDQANNLDFSYGSGPESSISLLYEHRPFYGKISFTKNFVAPLTIALQAEAGTINYGGINLPLVGGALCHRLFFNKHHGVELTLRLLLHQALDPLSVDLKAPSKPDIGELDKKFENSSMLDISYTYLF